MCQNVDVAINLEVVWIMRVAKLLAVFCLVFVLQTQSSYADNLSQVSKDPKIIQAINLMGGTSAEWAKNAILGNNVSQRPIKVRFRNLAELSRNYANYDALGWKDGNQLHIFINYKHSSAPAEAVASLLSHEAVHQDEHNSLEEETYAWGYEADVWNQMKKKYPKLNNIRRGAYPLVDRLNTLERNFKNGNYTTKNIRDMVYSNPGYKGLPVHSPGF